MDAGEVCFLLIIDWLFVSVIPAVWRKKQPRTREGNGSYAQGLEAPPSSIMGKEAIALKMERSFLLEEESWHPQRRRGGCRLGSLCRGGCGTAEQAVLFLSSALKVFVVRQQILLLLLWDRGLKSWYWEVLAGALGEGVGAMNLPLFLAVLQLGMVQPSPTGLLLLLVCLQCCWDEPQVHPQHMVPFTGGWDLWPHRTHSKSSLDGFALAPPWYIRSEREFLPSFLHNPLPRWRANSASHLHPLPSSPAQTCSQTHYPACLDQQLHDKRLYPTRRPKSWSPCLSDRLSLSERRDGGSILDATRGSLLGSPKKTVPHLYFVHTRSKI